MAGKGLGTGLGALFGEEAVGAGSGEFEYLPISRVEPRSGQPRTVFAEEELQELADSIGEHGVLQPLTVRRVDGGYYQIIAGERRWRAARMAGLREVPARIIEADDRKAMELALVENLQREGLNPIEEALGYRKLCEEFGMTQNEVAERVSKSRPVVSNALRLLSLPEPLLAEVASGALAAGSARALLAIDDEKKMMEAARAVIEGGLSARQAEALARRLSGGGKKKKKAHKAPEVDYAALVGADLTKKLGRKVRLVDGARKGRVEIEYYGYEDLDVLIGQLSQLGGKKADK